LLVLAQLTSSWRFQDIPSLLFSAYLAAQRLIIPTCEDCRLLLSWADSSTKWEAWYH